MGEQVHIEQAPSGAWFVSLRGWGRKFGDEEKAREHYESLLTGRVTAI
jgi:hypothetical protein